MIDTLSGINLQGNFKAYPYITGISGQSYSQISKLAVYLHITYLYFQAPQLSEMTSPREKSFCMIEYTKTNPCTSVQQAM
jgi:hypothetical protein